jgi:phosphohistidine phosphatase
MPGPYELYLIRHGVAEDRGDAWPDDAKRPLTEAGMARMRKSVRGLARFGVAIDLILTSPLVRARQTAEIVAAGLEPRPAIVSVDALTPAGTFTSLTAELEKHARRTRIALVGHEPNIGEIAARLVGSRHPIEFKKGAVCRIDVEQLPPHGPGDLRWFIPSRVFRGIQK